MPEHVQFKLIAHKGYNFL